MFIFRFFSRKREPTTSGERAKNKDKTPEPVGRTADQFGPAGRTGGLVNGTSTNLLTRSPTIKQSQTDLQGLNAPNQQKQLSVPQTSDVEAIGDEIYDGECLKLMNEYFYGIYFILKEKLDENYETLQVFEYSLDKIQLTCTLAG